VIERWIRSQRAAVADGSGALHLIGRDGVVRRVDGDSAELARAVLAFLAQPRSETEVIAHVEELAGPLGDGRAVVTQLLVVLAESGAISRTAVVTTPRRSLGANVVVAISGAIAATHAPALVSALLRRGHTVEVVLTEAARRFVAVEAIAAIAGREVHTSLWPVTPHAAVPHVSLAQWADLVVVYPASATTLGRIARGDFSDLVSAIALTTRAPVVLAPSMNVDMLAAPAVQRNLDLLRGDGFTVLHGIPSQEVADAPSVRVTHAGVAPAPGEVAATIEALRAAGVLRRRDDGPRAAVSSSAWDAIYRAGQRSDGAPLVPWASSTIDDDLAQALADHAPPGAAPRLLDVGCGLGQVARHAAAAGYHVVATELSEVALQLARDEALDVAITWIRDDICASALAGPFDVIVDRATLHALPESRASAWTQTMRRLTGPGGTLIIKTHRDGVPGITRGYSAQVLAELLPDFDLVADQATALPGITDPAPVASVLAVLRRR
jgi:hypothetical protein